MKKDSPTSWIEKNIDKMMAQISTDFRYQRQLPLKIVMHPLASNKFASILKSKSSYFPNEDFSFLNIPVTTNSRLPYGTFVVERFKT
jgi:hypothetical protein